MGVKDTTFGNAGRDVPDKDLLWKQYELHIELYKKYLELALQFNIFYYAATGALISYYFTKSDIPMMEYSLLLPILMSFGFVFLFSFGAWTLRIIRQDVFDLRDKLGLEVAPEIMVLQVVLVILAVLMLIVAFGILCLFLRA